MFYQPVPAVERIHALGFLHNMVLGMLTNEAAKTNAGKPSRQFLIENGFRVAKLFSPEHGLSVQHPDGEKVDHQKDTLTGLPVISLYGDQMKPSPDQLSGLDAVLFDVPDVGCRFYTYLWSMTYLMEACMEAGIPMIILDRPNPIGGVLSMSEGPMLDEIHCSSFIGRWNIPVRHSCTVGELAKFFRNTRLPALELYVITCEHWDRSVSFFESGHYFIPTSPAIRNAETALLYPGTGLLEGVNVSEGRGTDFPFKQAGAPWIDTVKWKKTVEGLGFNELQMTPVHFTPDWGMYAGEECFGLRFEVIEARRFKPVQFGLQLIKGLMLSFPEAVEPRLYQTAANPTGSGHLDKLTGVRDSFNFLLAGGSISTGCPDWTETIKPFLLY
jgi:uncharacterized protein YbbC (DUF1343 family)